MLHELSDPLQCGGRVRIHLKLYSKPLGGQVVMPGHTSIRTTSPPGESGDWKSSFVTTNVRTAQKSIDRSFAVVKTERMHIHVTFGPPPTPRPRITG